ncbi:MAG: hypothetical protein ACI96M_002194 [Candidatus Azotimanducaceae bacterium]|jgi:hypothetical protein
MKEVTETAAFLTAFGKHDSHAVTLSTGKPNCSSRAGLPYDRISWRKIVQLAQCPGRVEKGAAQFIVPSTYVGCEGRTHKVQLEYGQFGMLAIDIDEGSPTLDEVLEALKAVLGPVASLIYSSSSATSEMRKWRVLVPLAKLLAGADYFDTQTALFTALSDQNIICDFSLARAGQPVFLPNVPNTKRSNDGSPLFYQYCYRHGAELILTDDHPILVQRQSTRAATDRDRAQAAHRVSVRRLEQQQHYTLPAGEAFEPIEHFNRHHSVHDMLTQYGFEHDRKGEGWRSPLSTSGSFSIRDRGDHWITFSAWARNHGVGHESHGGNYCGDAFDLFAFFEHRGDKSAAVRSYIQAVHPNSSSLTTGREVPSVYDLPSGDLSTARARVETAFDDWKTAALAWAAKGAPNESDSPPVLPPVFAVRVTTGVGKSTSALKAIQLLSQMLLSSGSTGPIVMAVPRHDLAADFQAQLQAAGYQAEVYKGRDQEDCMSPGHSMCRRHIDAREVERSGCSVSETLCTQRGVHCPFRDVCGTRRQARTRAPIWIVPHAILWKQPPTCIGVPSALIVDEDPSQGLFAGFEMTPYQVSLDDLTHPILGLTDHQNADILVATSAIVNAARASIDASGRIEAADVTVSAEVISTARKVAFVALLKPDCGPMTPAGKLSFELKRVAPHNIQLLRIARLLEITRAAIEAGAPIIPGLQVKLVRTSDGMSVTAIQMHWKNQLGADWNVPTICTSATIRPELLNTIWPSIERMTEAQAVMPFTRVRQVTDRAFGQSSIVGDAIYNRTLRRRLLHYIEHRGRQVGGRVLVVAQKGVIEAIGPMAKGIDMLHFNALSGVDRYKDARLIVVLGRTQPAPCDVEARAELIINDAIARLPGWYGKTAAAFTMADGKAGPRVVTRRGKGQDAICGADQHPHPMAEAIRWAICEAELLQTVGRGRGVNRTADTPLQIDILTSVPLPLPVDEAGAFNEFEPTPADLMQARGVEIIDTSAKGVWQIISAVMSDLFPTADAARKGYKRNCGGDSRSDGQNLIRDTIGICPRERFIEAKAKAIGSRYAVRVRVRASSWAEAEELLQEYGIESEPVDNVQPLVGASTPPQHDIKIHNQQKLVSVSWLPSSESHPDRYIGPC